MSKAIKTVVVNVFAVVFIVSYVEFNENPKEELPLYVIVQWKFFFWILIKFHLADHE